MNSGNMPASSKSQSMPTSMGQSTQSNNGCYGGNDIQKLNRICRDFVQGYCRRKFCRVCQCYQILVTYRLSNKNFNLILVSACRVFRFGGLLPRLSKFEMSSNQLQVSAVTLSFEKHWFQ